MADLVTLFHISHCSIPDNVQFPDTVEFDYDNYIYEYTLGTL